MDKYNENRLSILKGISLIGSLLATGGSIYIQKVDHPSLMVLPNEFAVGQFRERYKRVIELQFSLTISSIVSSFLAFLSIRNSKYKNKSGSGYIWLLGSLLMFLNFPYTYFFVQPINRKLLSKSLDTFSDDTRSLLKKWEKLHSQRTLILLSAVGSFTYAIFKNSQK